MLQSLTYSGDYPPKYTYYQYLDYTIIHNTIIGIKYLTHFIFFIVINPLVPIQISKVKNNCLSIAANVFNISSGTMALAKSTAGNDLQMEIY